MKVSQVGWACSLGAFLGWLVQSALYSIKMYREGRGKVDRRTKRGGHGSRPTCKML